MKTYEINGTYGSNATDTIIFCAETNNGTWYVCQGGTIVNLTDGNLVEGVDVEALCDYDCFTVSNGIKSLSELEDAINS